ncbi:MAG: SnoaL-like domain-containing protein, partial [Kofleriaceae bacterium]|nr:SnoaL-like domain-containing protein [Kofleriaceae bacterium]
SGKQPSRALLIAAGSLTQLIGTACLILALASLPVAHDLKTGTGGVIASIVASLAAIVCGTLVWRGRLVPLALAAGLDVGFGIGLPRGNSAIGSMLRILPAEDMGTAETLVMVAAVVMFIAATLCVIAVPQALKLRQWARDSQLQPGASTHGTGMAFEDPVRRSAQTLPGLGPAKLVPTQVIRIDGQRKGKPAIIIGVAVTLIAIGIIVITATVGDKAEDKAIAATGSATAGSASVAMTKVADSEVEPAGSAVPVVDAALAPPTLDDFVARFHDALTRPDDLAALFDAGAFAFGADAHDVAEGRDAVIAQLREDIGEPDKVTVKFAHVGQDGDVGWIAEELKVGGSTFVITAVTALRDNAWTIAALHWAAPMPNATAYRLAREGELSIPDAIPDTHDESELAAAMRTAFASKPSFVAARSTRPEAFNFGSAPGERLKGGEAIQKIFGRINATLRLHDAVKVGMIGARGGWGVANVDFTDQDKDGTEITQTFRVIAAWVNEDAGWRIVVTQFSNAR